MTHGKGHGVALGNKKGGKSAGSSGYLACVLTQKHAGLFINIGSIKRGKHMG